VDDVSDDPSGSVSVAPFADTGLIALCQIARHLGVPASPVTLGQHRLVTGTVASKEDLIRIARRLGLRARLVRTHWDRLAKTPLPAIVLNTDGQFSIVSRVIDGRAAVHSPGAARPHLLERSEFEGHGPAS
jgi:ATP-binding cassette, subfamily B, bacterial HlyB/CyaB